MYVCVSFFVCLSVCLSVSLPFLPPSFPNQLSARTFLSSPHRPSFHPPAVARGKTDLSVFWFPLPLLRQSDPEQSGSAYQGTAVMPLTYHGTNASRINFTRR